MTKLARLKTSIPSEQHRRFAELAAVQGVSASQMLAKLVWTASRRSVFRSFERCGLGVPSNE